MTIQYLRRDFFYELRELGFVTKHGTLTPYGKQAFGVDVCRWYK